MTPATLDVQHGYATVNGVRLHYVEKGEGPVILMLHGFPESWWSWRCQIGPLAAAGFRVIALDLRAYGQSEIRGPYDIDTLAEDLRALLAHLQIARAHVVGHDWGGGLAWHFVALHPELVLRVAILNAPHPAPFQKALRGGDLGQLLRSWYMFFFLLPRLPELLVTANDGAWTRRFYRHVDGTHFGRGELAPFFDALRRPGGAKAAIDYYRAAVKRGLRAGSSFQHYPRVTAPALVVWGMLDRSLNFASLVPHTKEWVADLRIESIDDACHFVHCERPERVNRLLIGFFKAEA
jgi:pimeloyl-ACP methyl ester carboxylesterase